MMIQKFPGCLEKPSKEAITVDYSWPSTKLRQRQFGGLSIRKSPAVLSYRTNARGPAASGKRLRANSVCGSRPGYASPADPALSHLCSESRRRNQGSPPWFRLLGHFHAIIVRLFLIPSITQLNMHADKLLLLG